MKTKLFVAAFLAATLLSATVAFAQGPDPDVVPEACRTAFDSDILTHVVGVEERGDLRAQVIGAEREEDLMWTALRIFGPLGYSSEELYSFALDDECEAVWWVDDKYILAPTISFLAVVRPPVNNPGRLLPNLHSLPSLYGELHMEWTEGTYYFSFDGVEWGRIGSVSPVTTTRRMLLEDGWHVDWVDTPISTGWNSVEVRMNYLAFGYETAGFNIPLYFKVVRDWGTGRTAIFEPNFWRYPPRYADLLTLGYFNAIQFNAAATDERFLVLFEGEGWNRRVTVWRYTGELRGKGPY